MSPIAMVNSIIIISGFFFFFSEFNSLDPLPNWYDYNFGSPYWSDDWSWISYCIEKWNLRVCTCGQRLYIWTFFIKVTLNPLIACQHNVEYSIWPTLNDFFIFINLVCAVFILSWLPPDCPVMGYWRPPCGKGIQLQTSVQHLWLSSDPVIGWWR